MQIYRPFKMSIFSLSHCPEIELQSYLATVQQQGKKIHIKSNKIEKKSCVITLELRGDSVGRVPLYKVRWNGWILLALKKARQRR